MSDHDDFFQDELWEARGEEHVRVALEERRISEPRASQARSWLRRKEDARRAAREAEDTEIMSSARDAAWASARAAERSEKRAQTANWIALGALAVAFLALGWTILKP